MSLSKYIPNTITTLNLVCGSLGVVSAFEGNSVLAFCLMLLAAVFDFCDGFAARALGAYSAMGRELDSLCDMVSFGMLPFAMVYSNMQTYCLNENFLLPFTALLICVGAALRLAKFNVDPAQHDSFSGLASPVAALLCASLCCYVDCEPSSLLRDWCYGPFLMPLLSLLMCLLMVSSIPMFSMKFKKDQPQDLKIKRVFFVIECAVIFGGVVLLRTNISLAVCLCCVLYIVKNFIFLLPLRGDR